MAFALSSSAHGIAATRLQSEDSNHLRLSASAVQSCLPGKFSQGQRLGQRPGVRWGSVISSLWMEAGQRRAMVQCRAKTYTVEVIDGDEKHVLQVPEDETILSIALDENLELSHDCKLGVCMTCPSRLVKGNVDQSGGMLSDDVIEQGYALMCVSYPLSDCVIQTIPEEEILALQLATANDA